MASYMIKFDTRRIVTRVIRDNSRKPNFSLHLTKVYKMKMKEIFQEIGIVYH